ncbi:hypothetical protein BU17DRAFT_53891 [Hysterangium stoloniferum]|nr:hypothetical protein BU17DRAFT_53891 [Hysterangium stoloniferum]
MNIYTLPYDLAEHIIELSLSIHPIPSSIARVSSTWAEIALPLLHERIHLTSLDRLRLFATHSRSKSNSGADVDGEHVRPLRCSARGREVEIRLPGGTPSHGMWAMIQRALARCQYDARALASNCKTRCCRGVRELRLCLHSHMNDPNLSLVYPALSQINPQVFTWKGPDPEHHFSTAIISTAANALCKAMHHWSALQSLHLANISFLHDGEELPDAYPPSPSPGLIQLTISQAVFMLPGSVLSIVLHSRALRSCRLVDVYQHSIWGPRLRLGDVEKLVGDCERGDGAGHDCGEGRGDMARGMRVEDLKRVRRVLRCVARTERLMGGDRELP